jgi:hypothetical protein
MGPARWDRAITSCIDRRVRRDSVIPTPLNAENVSTTQDEEITHHDLSNIAHAGIARRRRARARCLRQRL